MNANKAVEAISELLESRITELPIIRYEKGKKVTGDYICVNALQVVYQNAVGTLFCNINLHFKDDIKGEPRTGEIFQLVEVIAGEGGVFEEPVYKNGNWYTLYSTSGLSRDTDNTHYVNIQIEVKFSNL